MDVEFDDRFLPDLLDPLLQFLTGLADHFLDAGGVDAAVTDQAFEGQTGDLAPNGVETGNHDGFGGIVYHELGPRSRLDGPDVAPLPADDLPLHAVVVEAKDGYGIFDRHLGAHPLDGIDDHLTGVFASLLLRFLQQFAA